MRSLLTKFSISQNPKSNNIPSAKKTAVNNQHHPHPIKSYNYVICSMRLQSAALLLTSALSTSKPSISLAFTTSSLLSSSFGLLSKHYQINNKDNQQKLSISSFSSFISKSSTTFTSSNNNNYIVTRKMSSSSSSSNNDSVTTAVGSSGKVALLQFKVSSSKLENQLKVQNLITSTMERHPNIKLIALPEIWNGPYATSAFSDYAEILPPLHYNPITNPNNNKEQEQNINLQEQCPSAKILFDLAMKYNIYIIGGSISEKDNDLFYNTCLCISPNGTLVAKHRKVHLFDIDVKGGIRFKESDTLTGGDTMSVFDTGHDLFGYIGVGIW